MPKSNVTDTVKSNVRIALQRHFLRGIAATGVKG
jgi:hypothetical protein